MGFREVTGYRRQILTTPHVAAKLQSLLGSGLKPVKASPESRVDFALQTCGAAN